ncbi:MAG: hypothetical protein HQK77_05200 [Desulfobacterales bacterium]|nr:hypothetical protein [Desulfobacterales bacterium]
MQRYRIVLNGALIKGHTIDHTIKNIATIFKINPAQVKQWFSISPTIIQSGLDDKTALTLLAALENAGAVCTVEIDKEQDDSSIENKKHQDVSLHDIQLDDENIPININDYIVETRICPDCGNSYIKNEGCPVCKENKQRKVELQFSTLPFISKKKIEPNINRLQQKPNLSDSKRTLLPDFFLKPVKWIWNHFTQRHRPVNKYLRLFWTISAQAMILIIIVIIVCIALHYLVNIFWYPYTLTFSGKHFVVDYPKETRFIQWVISKDPFNFSAQISVICFCIGFMLSVVAQFFFLIRFLFIPRGIFGKIMLWGFPYMLCVAKFVQYYYNIERFDFCCMLVSIPTLCVFHFCIMFAYQLLPELGDCIRFIRSSISVILKSVSDKNRRKRR